MKYLIVGLGNIGAEYVATRHNIGFMVLDALAHGASNIFFEQDRYAFRAEMKHAGRTLVLIKPTTYMNLSGKAVRYWMEAEKVPAERTLVIADDLSLPTGKIRIRAKGSAGGHNGLKSIESLLESQDYPRLRFGIGDNFPKGRQVDYVLGKFSENEITDVELGLHKSIDAVKSFVTRGLALTMTEFNR
ncbi:MAG: aminoacyl-tRNA hydrolase [Bacteroidia bacterium]